MSTSITDRAAQVLREIDAALALAEKATPEPWEADALSESFVWPQGCDNDNGEIIKVYTAKSRHDCAFIAASRTQTPKLLAMMRTAIEGLLEVIAVTAGNSVWAPSKGQRQASDAIAALCNQWSAAK